MEDETIRLLINKIENGLPDIKLRSIATLYTKISVGIIEHALLPRYVNLPGVLLQWINDNRARSEPLFKVLTIFTFFMKTEEGLVLLNQYEALDFFQEYRQFLLEQQPRHDQYTTVLQTLIKELLPLSSAHNSVPESQVDSTEVNPKKQQKPPKSRQSKEKQKPSITKEGIKMVWVVTRDPLGKKEEDQLYSLMMELQHSKKQLHLQWLKKIEAIVKYWGSKWFRYRIELINELTEQFSRASLKWLIIEILKALVRGIGQNARRLASEQLLLINLSGNGKMIFAPETQKISLTFKKQLFESVYSSQLLDELIKYNEFAKESQLFESLIQITFKYSPKYFEESLTDLIKKKNGSLNLQALNKNIEYFCNNFDDFPERISKILTEAPQQLDLTPEKFPILKEYLQGLQANKNFSYIARYKEDWYLGNNLHNIVEVMNNLEKGVGAIDARNGSIYIRLYLNSLLTLAVAVEKQDPLMTYYPSMKSLILKIAQRPSLRVLFFEEISRKVNSTAPIKYGSKNFSEADLSVLIFSQESMFKQLFYESFGDQSSLSSWLQVTLILVKKSRQFCELTTYACIYHSLTYHKNEKIKNTCKALVELLSKKGKERTMLSKLFSRSEEQRARIAKDLFGENGNTITTQLQTQMSKSSINNKKLLKISENSIENYIQIIFNKDIQEQISLNAAKQLLESLERIELTQNLQDLLNVLSLNIARSLSEPSMFSLSFLSIFIQMNGVLNQILNQKNFLKVDSAMNLLRLPLPNKVIQILLQNLYNSCYQSPFTTEKEAHFSSLLYPHLNYVQMKVGGYLSAKEQTNSRQVSSKNKLLLPNHQETLQFAHFIERLMFSILNNFSIKLDQCFVNIVEKEIGSILHASKGYTDLHFLAYGFDFISRHNYILPDKIQDYSSPLLNSLLTKDQSASNCQPIAAMISIIGCKRTRQIHSLLVNNPPGLWKYPILLKMESIDSSLMELIVKGLLGITYGKEAVLILRLVLAQARKSVLTAISQTLVLSSCIKFIRQDVDELLRKTSICVLTQLYKTQNLECQGWQDIFGSVVSVLLDQPLNINEANLLLNIIKTIIETNEKVFSQVNIIKMLIQKIVALLLVQSLNFFTAALIFEIISLIAISKRGLLKRFQLVDASISFISNIFEKKQVLNGQNIKLISSILDYLFLQVNHDVNLSKYLLTSTTLLKYTLNICKQQLSFTFSKTLLESLGRVLVKLSQTEEDLLIYKINQLIKTQMKSLIGILCINLEKGGLDYLKFVGWTMVIWLRNRQDLEPALGLKIAEYALNSSQPNLIKLIMPFSTNAKTLFMSSKYLQLLLKQNNVIIDSRLIKQSKDKKRKGKIYQLEQKQFLALDQFLSLLCAMFYWEESLTQEEIKQSEGLKKILVFLEKMYSCGQWDEETTKSYLKVITNMALSQPFAVSCSTRLSENAIMIEEMIGCVSKSENSEGLVKLSLKLMSLLVHFESIRSMVLRARVIEELSLRLIRGQERGDLNLEYIMDIIELFLSFSSYKDANIRLLNDKKILEVLLRILKLGKFSILEEKIVLLLSNLACFKSNKSTFMSNRDIHKTILGLLEDSQISYHANLLSLLYNILYKNSAALKLYRRPQVVQVIKKASSNPQNDVTKALLQALTSDESI